MHESSKFTIFDLSNTQKTTIMKKYQVTIGESNFQVSASNLKEAKKIANFHKRMEKVKGTTSVRLFK